MSEILSDMPRWRGWAGLPPKVKGPGTNGLNVAFFCFTFGLNLNELAKESWDWSYKLDGC